MSIKWTFFMICMGMSCGPVARPAFAIRAQELGVSYSRISQNADEEQELMRINNELIEDEVHRDIRDLRDIFTDDYVHVHTSGWVESRADFLNDFETGKRIYHSVDLENVHIQIYDRTALIMGNAHVKSASGGEKDNFNRFLAVWVQRNGHWRLAEWMTTRLEDQRSPWNLRPDPK